MPLLIPGATPPPPVVATRDDIHLDVRLERGGVGVDLTGWVQSGAEGLDDPQVSPVIQRTAGTVGGIVTGVDIPPRRVTLEVLMWLDGGPEYLAARSRLGQVTSPYGDTRITVVCRTGVSTTTRVITGRRNIDQAPVLARDVWGADGWQRLELSWDCPGVWWVEESAWAPTPWAGPAPVTGFFGAHFFPANVADSTILGAPTRVSVPGDSDVAVAPTWSLDGPGTTLTVAHVQTGRVWALDVTDLPRPVTVVCDPRRPSVTDGTGASQWTRLAAPYDLWAMLPGEQDVTVTVTGATTDTLVTGVADALRWRAFS